MLFSLGHGQHVVEEPAAATRGAPAPDTAPIAAVAPGVSLAPAATRAPREMALAGEQPAAPEVSPPALVGGKFGYYFPQGAGLPEQADMPGLLDALADSMVEPQEDASVATNSKIPPIYTYLGQFIDHDLTANTDRDTAISIIDGAIAPLPRSDVETNLRNLRDGSLGLDSLYGDAMEQGPFADKLANLMRFPGDKRKMRLAFPSSTGRRMPLPADNAADLLRLGFLLKNGHITLAELQALQPQELRDVFIDPGTGEPRKTLAIIGDARNDENLLVAQLHVLFLRLHNKLVDAMGNGDFARARRLTTRHYQWLVVNSFLPTICDPAIVQEVIDKEAPLYADFFAAQGGGAPKMPMPLEFSVAGFRFGHSMIRATYDHNRVFGTPEGEGEHILDVSPFDLLFAFTGSGGMPGEPADAIGQLPQRWVIEWERFIKLDPAHPLRSARKIDTDLAFPLSEMRNQPLGVFKHLARRNLRRGYRLNLPTAQACIAAIGAAGFAPFRTLTAEQLASGSETRHDAVVNGGFDTATPLWFYILKEAEVLACGQHLGPLGSHIVANTLVGLVVQDPKSYWNRPGGRWSPATFNAEEPIDSLEDMAEFGGML